MTCRPYEVITDVMQDIFFKGRSEQKLQHVMCGGNAAQMSAVPVAENRLTVPCSSLLMPLI